MSRRRSSFRDRLGLQGWVIDAGGWPGLAARSIDLSRTGVGLICAGWPDPTGPVRVTLEDVVDGQPVGRQWSGRVSHARAVAGGVRVGIAFEWPVGPGARSEAAVRASQRPPQVFGGVREDHGDRTWVVPAVALAGLAADQLSKAWATSAGPGLFDILPDWLAVAPGENPGALASLAGDSPLTAPLCAAGALVLAGLSVSRSGSTRSRGFAGSAGAGLLGAGLLGNSVDRLTLGYVRDFLVSGLFPRWSFNLADVFLAAGALALLAARPADKRHAQRRS